MAIYSLQRPYEKWEGSHSIKNILWKIFSYFFLNKGDENLLYVY